MKKFLIAIALLVLVKLGYAQDLVKKIPANAFTVATIKGDKVFKMMFVKDFNESFLGKKFLKETSEAQDKEYTSIEDFGINLDKSMYYYNQLSDSITYNCFLIPLKDAAKFESMMNNGANHLKITTQGDVKTTTFDNSTSMIAKWNKDMLYVAIGSVRTSFFADSAKSAQYGIKDIRYQYNDEAVMADSTVAIVDSAAAVAVDADWNTPPEPIKVTKKVPVKKSTAKKKSTKKKVAVKPKAKAVVAPKRKKAIYIAPPIPPNSPKRGEAVVDSAVSYTTTYAETDLAVTEPVADHYDSYQEERKQQDDKIKQLALVWMTAEADKIFNGQYESIESNKSYTSSLDNKAIGEVWVSSLQDVYNAVAPEFGTYGKQGLMKGYGSLTAKLFMDDKSFRISTGLELAKEQADAYKKIMNRKLNKNFLKYVNSEKAIGFMGYSIDTKAYLEEFPKLMKQTYGYYVGARMDEEIEMGTDLFSLLLDEEAVSKVIKGDALFVINGLNTKDVTYTSYDYDDDYNQKEVTKTKKETMPDFLFMFSSEDNRLMNKLIKYGMNKNMVTVNNNIYKIEEKKSPVDIYFMIKDGIVFFGNSFSEMQSISNNSFSGSITKAHKTLLTQNNFSFLFNTKNLVGKIPTDEIGGEETAKKFNETLGKMGNIIMKSNVIKGNIVSADISAEIPDGQENAMKYLFSLIENAAK